MNHGSSSIEQAHGGVAALLGSIPNDTLDLSVNLNPYGPDPELVSILKASSWREYPDPHCQEIRKAWAQKRSWDPECLLFGNGANELLWAAARALLKAGDSFTCIEPVYSEFHRAAATVGARAHPLLSSPESSFRITWAQLSRHIKEGNTRVVYLCNPQSPTGGYHEPEEIEAWIKTHPEVTLILDESFLSLSPHFHKAKASYPNNVLRIVSLTKDHALAGLRLGYCYGSWNIVAAMRAQIPGWSVSALAQVAALHCAQNDAFLDSSRSKIAADKQLFEAALRERHLNPLPTASIYLMLAVPEAQQRAARLWKNHRVLVRSCSSYAYPDWWRLAIRPAAEQERFFAAFDEECR